MIRISALPLAGYVILGILLDLFGPFSLPIKLGKIHPSYYVAVGS